MKAPKKIAKPKGPKSAAAAKFDEAKHKRGLGGKFAKQAGKGDDAPKAAKAKKPTVGETALKTSGVEAGDEIVLLSTRLRSYGEGMTVRDFVDGHPKGRAYALRKLTADHKAGRIGFKGESNGTQPPIANKYDPDNYSDFSDTDDATIRAVEQDLYKRMLAKGETPLEIDAINHYSSNSYVKINNLLRKRKATGNTSSVYQDKEFGDTIRNIDTVMKRSRMLEDTIVYRGMSGSFAKTLLGKKVGTTFRDKGYTSASLHREVADGSFGGADGVVLRLMLPKGNPAYLMNGRGASRFPMEHEVLLPRGSKFRIVERSGNVITAEIL